MQPTRFKRARLATDTRVKNSASLLGQTIMLAPPKAVFWSLLLGAWVIAPLVVGEAETVLEEAAWLAGRVWAGGVALTHLFEEPSRSDGPKRGARPPETRAPIVIVPQPDISAPPMPRQGGQPPDAKPTRHLRHRKPPPPDATGLPRDRHPGAITPAPGPQREADGGTP